jgi:hypothetical protein
VAPPAVSAPDTPNAAGHTSQALPARTPYRRCRRAAFDVQLQSFDAIGKRAWLSTSTRTTPTALAYTPSAEGQAQGAGCNLSVTWTAPAIDSTHNVATSYNLRSSTSGGRIWTTVPGILRVVGEQFHRSDYRTDRTRHSRHLLPLDADYLWVLAQRAGAITTGALVTSVITVS